MLIKPHVFIVGCGCGYIGVVHACRCVLVCVTVYILLCIMLRIIGFVVCCMLYVVSLIYYADIPAKVAKYVV